MFRSSAVGILMLFASLSTACSASSSDPPDEQDDGVDQGALEAAMSTAAVQIACKTLGAVGECGTVSVCEEKTSGKCEATDGARASNRGWEAMCPAEGIDRERCGELRRFCQWKEGTQCAARGGAGGADVSAAGTDREVTCRLLQAVNQCGRVSICNESTEAQCKTKPPFVSDPFWGRYCPQLSDQRQCGFQSNCKWDSVTSCLPLDQ